MLKTGDQQLLRQINRMVLVRQLLRTPGLSRADLAQAVGLTRSTVSLSVRDLVEEGWLRESDLLVTGSLGRRPTPLHIDRSRLTLLGAELGIDEIRIVATDLLGDIVEHRVVAYQDVTHAQASLRLAARQLVQVARNCLARGRQILGVGVGLHGGVDEQAGVLHFAPNLGWKNIRAAALLTTQFAGSPLQGLPLHVQNEADVAALAEFEFAQQPGADPLVYLSIGYGVGAGVVVQDTLLTGHRGFAGEVGHIVLQVDGPLCSCGRRGCAEALIGLRSLLGGAGLAPARRNQALKGLHKKLQAGQPAAMQAVRVAGRHLGVLLNNLWVAFDPVRMVVGGPALALGDPFLQPARDALKAYSAAAQLPAPTVTASRYGADAVAIGAAALVRYHLIRPLSTARPGAPASR